MNSESGCKGHSPLAKGSIALLAGMAGAVFLLCLFGGSPVRLLEGLPFYDVDDVMRMVQVIDLWEGAGWYDLIQERMNPPAGLAMHWSRLPDIPLLGALALSEQFLSQQDAVVLVAHVVPALLGVLFFIAFVWAAAPLVWTAGLPFAGLIGIVLFVPLTAFLGGRVDHHGWQLLLAMISAGGVLRLARGDVSRKPVVIAAVSGALGFWVGAEATVYVGLTTAALALIWIRQGGRSADRLAFFGITLVVVTALIFPLALPIASWATPACDAFSLVSLGLSCTAALFGVGIMAVERTEAVNHWSKRFGASILIGGCALGVFVWSFPICLDGPYAGISKEAARMLTRIAEAQSLWSTVIDRPSVATTFLVAPVIALVIAMWLAATSTDANRRTLWITVGFLISGGIALEFWQIRGNLLANAYAGLAFVWLAAKAGAKANREPRLLVRLWFKGGPALGVASLSWLAAVIMGSTSNVNVVTEHEGNCDWTGAAAALRQMAGPNEKPLLIAAPIGIAPAFLLLTSHHVLGSLYHRNTEGVEDTVKILYKDEKIAREAIKRRGVNIVVVCNQDKWAMHERHDAGGPLFFDRLVAGQVPNWLFQIPVDSSISLYEVVR